ncbi:MAG: MarR family transcriptional regulator [Clostridia bacterium]|nr:MarR family transcriptional regulator [Clostridia bacterium]
MQHELTAEELLMRKLRRCGHLLYHRFSLNFSQNRILLLCQAGPVTQKTLACEMQLQPGSLSELLSKMEQAGLIERRRSEGDKRNCEILITPAGQAQAAAFCKERQELAKRLLEPLDAADQQQLERILDLLLNHWNNQPERKE